MGAQKRTGRPIGWFCTVASFCDATQGNGARTESVALSGERRHKADSHVPRGKYLPEIMGHDHCIVPTGRI